VVIENLVLSKHDVKGKMGCYATLCALFQGNPVSRISIKFIIAALFSVCFVTGCGMIASGRDALIKKDEIIKCFSTMINEEKNYTLIGPEDLVLDVDTKVVYVPWYSGRGSEEKAGGLFYWEESNAGILHSVKVNKPFFPHGIYLYSDLDASNKIVKKLYVLNHRSDSDPDLSDLSDSIDVFDVSDDGKKLTQLAPIIISNKSWRGNDLVVVDGDKIYLTVNSTSKIGQFFDMIFYNSKVAKYQDGTWREATGGLAFSNGIAYKHGIKGG